MTICFHFIIQLLYIIVKTTVWYTTLHQNLNAGKKWETAAKPFNMFPQSTPHCPIL